MAERGGNLAGVVERVIRDGEPFPDIERAMTESGMGTAPFAEAAVEDDRFGLRLRWRCDCGEKQRETEDWIISPSPTEIYYENVREGIRGKRGGVWEKILQTGAGVECECGVLGCPA